MHGNGFGVIAGKQAAIGQSVLNLLLLGLQCGNRGGQGFQLALFFVAELFLRGAGALAPVQLPVGGGCARRS